MQNKNRRGVSVCISSETRKLLQLLLAKNLKFSQHGKIKSIIFLISSIAGRQKASAVSEIFYCLCNFCFFIQFVSELYFKKQWFQTSLIMSIHQGKGKTADLVEKQEVPLRMTVGDIGQSQCKEIMPGLSYCTYS